MFRLSPANYRHAGRHKLSSGFSEKLERGRGEIRRSPRALLCDRYLRLFSSGLLRATEPPPLGQYYYIFTGALYARGAFMRRQHRRRFLLIRH